MLQSSIIVSACLIYWTVEGLEWNKVDHPGVAVNLWYQDAHLTCVKTTRESTISALISYRNRYCIVCQVWNIRTMCIKSCWQLTDIKGSYMHETKGKICFCSFLYICHYLCSSSDVQMQNISNLIYFGISIAFPYVFSSGFSERCLKEEKNQSRVLKQTCRRRH